jgi:hypothetical protein
MLTGWFHRTPKAPREGAESLPESLRSRLLSLPQELVLCRDVDRQWAELLAGELEEAKAQGLRRHAADCQRCGLLLATLGTAREDREPIPKALLTRLRVPLRARRPAPWWVVDVRFALAASYLVALVALPAFGLKGDPGSNAKGAVREKTLRTVEELERGQQAVATTLAAVTTGLGDRTKKAVALADEAVESFRGLLDWQTSKMESREMSEEPGFPEKE